MTTGRGPASVEICGLTKRFGSTVAVSDVTLRVAAGKVLCLFGPARSGKSTLLRLVAGLETVDQGRIAIAGTDVTMRSPRVRRVGLVTGPQAVFGNLTVRKNVEFALNAQRLTAIERAELSQRALVETDLVAHADKRRHQLTAAQCVRVVLARALVAQPTVLLIEDAVGLDAAAHDRLRDLIRSLQRSRPVTTVWATRDPRTALAVADEIAVLHDGRLVRTAIPSALAAEPADDTLTDLTGAASWVPAVATDDGRWRVLDRVVPADRPARAGVVAMVAVRPDQVVLGRGGPARVSVVTYQGSLTRLVVDDPVAGVVLVDVLSRDATDLRPGSRVRLGLFEGVNRVSLQRVATPAQPN